MYNHRGDDRKQVDNDREIDFGNVISISNHKDTLQSFVEKSPLGMRFALIVLFYMARNSVGGSQNSTMTSHNLEPIDLSPFSFTSKEFSDTYNQLATDMGLTKYLIRDMAFAEFMLTLEYLAIVREDEFTGNYRFKVNFNDLKWLASLSLQQVTGGQGMSDSDLFYSQKNSTSNNLSSDNTSSQKKNNRLTAGVDTRRATELIKDLSLSVFSRGESEEYGGSGTGTSYDNLVRPRSKDYGLYRPHFAHRVPPTTYRFRKPNDAEWKRIIGEFFTDMKCVNCDTDVLPEQFDVWIGEPLEDNTTLGTKRDQRMSEVRGGINAGAIINKDKNHNPIIDDIYDQQYLINHDIQITDREVLTYNYGVIPMDGRDAFIAFAKPKNVCPNCGSNPADSVSLMPKY